MKIVAVLLDKAKNKRSVPSDNALRERFGVTRQTISKWRSGEAYPTQDHIARLAEMAGDDPAQWLVAVQAERETGAAGVAWARLARQLGVAATVAVAALITGWMPLPAQARTLTTAQAEQPATVCIMRSIGEVGTEAAGHGQGADALTDSFDSPRETRNLARFCVKSRLVLA